MNRMIKIFIGIFCFIALFSCNNDDNISTAQVNSITTTTIDDGLSATDGGVQSPQGSIGDASYSARMPMCSRLKDEKPVQMHKSQMILAINTNCSN